MDAVRFAWDEAKAAENLRKHGVAFEKASTAFADANARLKHDPEHSEDEDRFILLGLSARLRLLVVCHAYREGEMECAPYTVYVKRSANSDTASVRMPMRRCLKMDLKQRTSRVLFLRAGSRGGLHMTHAAPVMKSLAIQPTVVAHVWYAVLFLPAFC